MAAQVGRELVIRIGDGGSPETFAAFAGMRSNSIAINNDVIDVTIPDAANPGGPLHSANLTGVQAMSLSGSGIFEDAAQMAAANAIAMSGDAHAAFEIDVPGFGKYTGAFHIDSLTFNGEYTDALQFEMSMSSNGAIAFEAF